MGLPKTSRIHAKFIKTRESFFDALKEANMTRSGSTRTLEDTQKTLNALNAQHKYFLAERQRLANMRNWLDNRGNNADARILQKRIHNLEKEDKGTFARAKLLDYYLKKARGE
ncbi:MAG: hypothetical protein AABW59_00415 [archaeon]